MSSRSKSEIVSQILEAANRGSGAGGDDCATKTEIMYKVFLSHEQLKEYLMILTESDLLRYDGETHTYKTTEKGIRFLDTLNRMDEMIKVQET
jgi:predicted transcriptional regulator